MKLKLLLFKRRTFLLYEKNIFIFDIKGEPELTDPFNLLINVKLRML